MGYVKKLGIRQALIANALFTLMTHGRATTYRSYEWERYDKIATLQFCDE